MPRESLDKAKVLIVDDEKFVREILQKILGDEYDCTLADSVRSALDSLKKTPFSLVLSDIQMPGASGLELISQISRFAPDAVAVMISGAQSIDTAIESMRRGAFDYIKKPFDFEQVKAAIKRALEYHSMKIIKREYENHLEELVERRTLELIRLSFYDQLTGIPNRVLFEDRLKQSLAVAQIKGHRLCVMKLSVDRFEMINNSFGSSGSDKMMQEIAARLTSLIGESETVARLEGCEFIFLFPAITETQELVNTLGKIKESFKNPLLIGSQEVFVTTSIGISLLPDDAPDAQTLLKNAGVALQRARERGGDNYQFYTTDMNVQAAKRLVLESSLRRALENDELKAFYQPKMSVSKPEQIVGMEALIRWNHPQFGVVSPAEFIPLAEETGLIIPIGEWILETACIQYKKWQSENKNLGNNLKLSVNLSPRQFKQPDLFTKIIEILRRTEFNPKFLELEITESSIMQNLDFAIELLTKLKQTGIKIAVDDFGTGYSSLAYLKLLPIDILKIDKTFIREINVDERDAALVTAVISLAHNLGLEVVAEGVENKAQLQLLCSFGCNEWQGYLSSAAVSSDQFGELLQRSEARKASPTLIKSNSEVSTMETTATTLSEVW